MSNLIETIESDLKAAWGVVVDEVHVIESAVEADALVIWADFKAIVTAALPAEYSTLKTFILKALEDVQNNDLADIETAVLNMAQESEEWIKNIGSATLQAVIAVVKAGAAKV
jgi:hypothetical protein